MTVNWMVTLLGIIITLLGYFLIPDNWGYGILGFGIATIVLGVLNMFRRSVEMAVKSN